MRSIIKNIIFPVLDLLFPSYCVNCGKHVSYSDSGLCCICRGEIEFLSGQCDICSGELIDNNCNICLERRFFIDKNITIAPYRGVIREILHNFKFNKKRRLYKFISALALDKIIHYSDIDIVSSVPMNRKKRWDRGFNQSELIAKEIAKKINKPYYSFLKEKYNYKTQRKLGYRDRFLNVLDRYKIINTIRKKQIIGKNLLIIDDVFTTGATINECGRILKSSGAARVYSLTIARADIKRVIR